MGLLDILGSVATIGANTQGNYLQGQAAGQQQAQQNFMEMLNAKRQKALDEQNALLHAAQIENYKSEAAARLAPPQKAELVVAPGSTVLGADRKPIFTAEDRTKYKDYQMPDGTFGTYDLATGLDTRTGQPAKGIVPKDPNQATDKFQLIKDDKTGQYVRVRVNGPEGPVGAVFPKGGGGGGGGGTAQLGSARLITVMNEAPFILKRMDEFEKKQGGNGKFDLPFGSAAAAQIQAGPQSPHPGGAFAQELAARVGNSDVNQYFADAARMARLQQLLSARGGSEAMVGQESRLMRSQIGDDAAKRLAAKQARETMVGKFGAVMQVLTDEQKAKLAQGIAAIEAGSDVVETPDGRKVPLAEFSKDIFSTPTATAPAGGGNPNTVQSKTISTAVFGQLSKEDQAYFLKKGYRVTP